jgi:hypothetical protein
VKRCAEQRAGVGHYIESFAAMISPDLERGGYAQGSASGDAFVDKRPTRCRTSGNMPILRARASSTLESLGAFRCDQSLKKQLWTIQRCLRNR